MLIARKTRDIARNSLLILLFVLMASKISVTLFKTWEMSNVRPDFEDFRSPKFLDIGRIRRVPDAIENFVVNGAGEKSRVHRPESRICAWQSIGFRAIVAGLTISPSFEVLRGLREKESYGDRKVNVESVMYRAKACVSTKITIHFYYNSPRLCV